ncbi:unnamed protein product [Parascedosporium putredinis]|uniref:DNA polymerase n=1 Tax=Parascedosporium putredinis TaxID=1442378 RepID=A0A9P1M655_9PEZI|nr:unnamed protein product [Parascedosporium putredinis]CAI7988030.1 unnamed protein product [Parascedosporium putredinis]
MRAHSWRVSLLVEYNGSLAQEAGEDFRHSPRTPSLLGAYMYRLHMSIDYALAVSYRRDQSGTNAKFVARISLVKGVPFYGFHVGYHYFLKIYVFNPVVISRLSDLLLQGVIMKQKFQPYETHLQYILQFMCDYNLYGCDYLDVSKVRFRAPVPQSAGKAGQIDICAQDIANRKAVKERRLHHDFVERIQPIAPEIKLLSSMAGLWRDETRRRMLKLPALARKTTSSPFPPGALVSMSPGSRNPQSQGWIHEEEYKSLLRELISNERSADEDGAGPDFDTFVEPQPGDEEIRTVLESVTDLYPDTLRAALGLVDTAQQPAENGASDVEVNAQEILPAQPTDEDYFPHDSDEDVAAETAITASQEARNTATMEALGPLDTIPLGLCASALRTGRRVHIPITAKLLAAAQDGHFISQEDDEVSETDSRSSSKRSRTPDPSQPNGAKPAKRPRLEDSLPRLVAPDGRPLSLSQKSQASSRSSGKRRPSKSPISSQQKDKDQSNLNFPIVKDPSEPSSQSSSSQAKQKLGVPSADVTHTAGTGPSSNTETPRESKSARKQVRFGIGSKDLLSPISPGLTTPSKSAVPALSNEKDVPGRPIEFAGREFRLEGNTLPYLPDFNLSGAAGEPSDEVGGQAQMPNELPDARRRRICTQRSWEFAKPLQPMMRNKNGFKYSQKKKSTGVVHETQYMSTMSVEIHVNTRGKFVPNPEEDEVQCIFWCVKSDDSGEDEAGSFHSGIVVLSEDGSTTEALRRMTHAEVLEETTELDLFVRMIGIVRSYDPDIMTGYEVHGGSWGYLIERARLKYDYDLCDEFSRMKSNSHGRHMINVWRAMRGELNLLQYTPENVAWHLLHRRVPHYPWRVLTSWYKNGRPRDLFKLIRHYLARTKMNLEILDANELIPAPANKRAFSARKQVGGQNALECLPLVMEPQSAFYTNPVLVLDFQSLYPSVMIAYNYCYSTLLELLKDHVNIAPNGMMYATATIRKSLLAKMLTEILETRFMVKSGMKQDKGDRRLQRLLNNRQLALKLLANVTYGYTSASYSGRMPCAEIADSIVQTGRETLEKAIAYIHSRGDWNAEVVYGDTDSLFVSLKGRTKDQAFDIGAEIAQAITDMNPRPIKLKFEKVYFPCVLLAKKRYVGYKYESKDQVEPEFDAKGIETALKILFETADLSQVKAYYQSQCDKIMRGAVSVQDFCFAKEDARAEPQYGERVPYVVATGAPGARLIDRCIAPEDLLQNSHVTLDADARQWYDEMPKVRRVRRLDPAAHRKTLESYMSSASCAVCGAKTRAADEPLCDPCRSNVPASVGALRTRLARLERSVVDVDSVCSKDCPVYYTRVKEGVKLRSEQATVNPIIEKLLDTPSRLEW